MLALLTNINVPCIIEGCGFQSLCMIYLPPLSPQSWLCSSLKDVKTLGVFYGSKTACDFEDFGSFFLVMIFEFSAECFLRCVEMNRFSIAEFILEIFNYDPNVVDEDGRAPLPDLTSDDLMIKLLLQHGARVNNIYQRYDFLLGNFASKQPPDNSVSIFFIGDSRAGKSTLIKAFLSSDRIAVSGKQVELFTMN